MTPCPQRHCCAPDFSLFFLCHFQISLFNIQVDLQIAFLYESLSLWLWPLHTLIRAKNSFANENQRSAALPHRETGCLPIVCAAWERRASPAQPGPAHLRVHSKQILFNSGIISLNVSPLTDIR